MLHALIVLGLHLLQVPAPSTWEVPAECPDRAALTGAIERRLGRPLGAGELRFAGTISRQAAAPRYRLRLELETGGRGQTRTLTAGRCASLVDATALLVVLSLREAEAVVPEPAPTSAPVEPPSPEPPSEPDPVDPVDVVEPVDAVEPVELLPSPLAPVPPAPRRGPGALVRVHGGPEFGAVPGFTGAVGLATGLLWRRARLELQGVYLAPRGTTIATHTLRASLFAGAALGCGRLGRGRLEVPLCGGLELGAMRSRVTGPGARSGSDLWLAGVATAGLAWHLGARLSLTVALHGLVHLYTPRFEVRDPAPSEPLFRPQRASGRLLFGLEIRLGDRW